MVREKKNQTTLIETFSYENKEDVLLINLKSKLEKLAAKLAGKTPVTISFFGDSISDVDRLSAWYGGASCREAHYAQVFRRMACQHWDTPHIMVHYFGICAQNTYEGLGRIHLLENVRPDLTVVAFGANDLAHHTLPPAGTARALELIFDRLRGPVGSEVVTMAASSGGPQFDLWPTVEPLFAAQRGICAQKDVPFVDTHAELLRRLDAGEDWLRYFPSHDNCHPNDEGHRLWGERLFEVVKAEVEAASRGTSPHRSAL